MKQLRNVFLLLLLMCVGFANAQIQTKIFWSFSQERVNDSTELLKFKARLVDGHHLYSQYTPEGGPIPTEFSFARSGAYKLIGKPAEPKPKAEFDSLFGVEVRLFKEDEVVFTQEVRVLSEKDFEIKGEISGMTCNDEGCIPFDQEAFKFTIKGRSPGTVTTSPVPEESIEDAPEEAAVAPTVNDTKGGADAAECRDYIIEGLSVAEPEEEQGSYWLIFLLGFGGGLLALLTPCVFPMIPLTVSFFTKNSGTRRKGLMLATLYGLSIAAIYTLIAVPFVVSKIPPDTLNEIATSAWLNILFFVIFVVFAISFFGYFEITLPSGLANKADSASGVGGILGVFFMALTLALVSFSCTGPILGSFLAGTLATNPDPYNILFVMLGFGVSLGLPFALFAAFPAWLSSLPKSGGWLNSVKVVLGFLELGMALKFLSNADLVQQWGLLKRETFLAIWAILAVALFAYLMGFIRFPHDSRLKKRSMFRVGLAIAFLGFGVYLTTGVFGRNLNLISGFPPPLFYSYQAEKARSQVVDSDTKGHCPDGIPCENDFEKARERSILENKPLLIDFTGWACVNCRRMEEGVWVDPDVKKIMSEEYILVSLYVDEKAQLPESEQFVSCITGKRVKTVGNKWSNMQVVNFNSNSQPQYVLLSPEGKLLNEPAGYSGRDEYLSFLKQGIDIHKRQAGLN